MSFAIRFLRANFIAEQFYSTYKLLARCHFSMSWSGNWSNNAQVSEGSTSGMPQRVSIYCWQLHLVRYVLRTINPWGAWSPHEVRLLWWCRQRRVWSSCKVSELRTWLPLISTYWCCEWIDVVGILRQHKPQIWGLMTRVNHGDRPSLVQICWFCDTYALRAKGSLGWAQFIVLAPDLIDFDELSALYV